MKSLKTVQSIAKFFKIFTLIIFIFTAIGTASLIIGGSVLIAIPNMSKDVAELISDLSSVDSAKLGISMIAEAVYLATECYVTFFLYRYFKKEIETGTPFTYEGAHELFIHGIVTLTVPLGGVIIADIIMAIAGTGDYFSNQYDALLGVIMIFISFVLKHGADIKAEAEAKLNNEICDENKTESL